MEPVSSLVAESLPASTAASAGYDEGSNISFSSTQHSTAQHSTVLDPSQHCTSCNVSKINI
jgi:hypothetical protein